MAEGADETAEPRGAELLGAEPLNDPAGVAVDRVVSITPSPEAARQDLELCMAGPDTAEPKSCTYGNPNSDRVVALAGDSHAGQWIPALAQIADERGWKLVTFIKELCPFANIVEPKEGGQGVYESCVGWNDEVAQRLAGMEGLTLFVTSNIQRTVLVDGQPVSRTASVEALTQGLRDRWTPLASRGVPVLALGDTPWPGIDVPDCVSGNGDQLTRCAVARDDALVQASPALADAAQATPGARFFDLFDAVCPSDPCAPVIGGVLVYADTNHMTATYAATLRERLAPAVDELVPRSG